MKPKYVLDSSAVLALLQQESGGHLVAAVTRQSTMSAVNHCEVLLRLAKRRVPFADALSIVEALGIQISSFDTFAAIRAAATLPDSKDLSLGDRCCLSLGAEKALPIFTADRNWTGINCEATVLQIRGEDAVGSLER